MNHGDKIRSFVLNRVVKIHDFCFNPLILKIHIQSLQTDLHTFLLQIVERIWFKIKAFSLW